MSIARTAWLVSVLVVLPDPTAARVKMSRRRPRSYSAWGKVPRPLKLTAEELAGCPGRHSMPRIVTGRRRSSRGFPVVAVLKAAGIKFGSDLRGPALANYLVVEATDGYRAVFSLPEIDPDFTDHILLLADRRDGKPLGKNEGPLRVVVLGENRPCRDGSAGRRPQGRARPESHWRSRVRCLGGRRGSGQLDGLPRPGAFDLRQAEPEGLPGEVAGSWGAVGRWPRPRRRR